MILLYLAVVVLAISANWILFKKAGEPGWACIVPIYNAYVMFKIVWGKGWMFLLALIPIVNFVIIIMHSFKLARSFGKGAGFGWGLLLLSPIFYMILAFGNAEYIGPDGYRPAGPSRYVSNDA